MGEPTVEEFATWWHPSDALDQFLAYGDDGARDAVLALLADGLIPAVAEKLLVGGRDLGLKSVPREVWMLVRGTAFWSQSWFRIPVLKDGEDRSISAHGIRLDPKAVVELAPPQPVRSPIDFELPDLSFGVGAAPPSAPPPGRRPGRRSGTNGEPIARVVKRLLSLSERELRAYKVEALTSELVAEYVALGLLGPHEDNARRDARGILRALREAG